MIDDITILKWHTNKMQGLFFITTIITIIK